MFKRVVHPGHILKDEVDAFGLTPTAFARQIEVQSNGVTQIMGGKRLIAGANALRFGHRFDTNPQFHLNLQGRFALAIANRQAGQAIRRLPAKPALPLPNLAAR